MTYSQEEQEEMRDIIAAFQDFIDASNTFEIVFSSKLGFLWLEILPVGIRVLELESAQALRKCLYRRIYAVVIQKKHDENQIKALAGERINRCLQRTDRFEEYQKELDIFLQTP